METVFWSRLKKICEERGVTPTGMCKEMGISTGNPSFWKSGMIPSTVFLKRISDYFHVEPEYFVGETETACESFDSQAAKKMLLFGRSDVSDKTLEAVLAFAKFAAQEEKGPDKK